MNFIDYVIKSTDRYNNIPLSDCKDKQMAITLQVINYRARCIKERLDKEKVDMFDDFMAQFEGKDDPKGFYDLFNVYLDLDTELDPGYFDRIIIDPNKESEK